MSLLTTASLVITPNAGEEGTLFSIVPDTGLGDMSVVRATTATRVNSAGLVELVPYNYNTYSENFITSWGTDGTSTATNNFTTAPNGMMTAAKLVSNVANGYAYKFNTVPNGTFTLSYYIKASANTTISIAFNDYGGNGYIGSYGIAVTTEWQRISLTANLVGTSLLIDYSQLQLGVDYYIWGCQINEGAIKDYQKTETRLNIPRLDYSNGTCPSLLVEPQRTNLLTYSSSFDNAAWTKLNASISANTIASPSGIQDADLLTENTANGYHVIYRSDTGTSNTFSFYAKSNGRNWVGVLSNNGDFTFFNISNGTLGTVAPTSTATIEDAGNGWYRCTVYNTHPTFGASIYLSTGNGIIDYLGNGTSGAYIWGAQLEVGSYPTSYIPTTSASVTRNADVISKTGISSLIGQTEGVVFLDFVYTELDSNGLIPITIGSNSSPNEMYYFIEGNERINFNFIVGGTDVLSIQTAVGFAVKGTRYKIALAYKANDFAVYINGVLIGTQNSGAITGFDDFYFGYPNASGYSYPNRYNAAALWQTRLTNAQLATLTTI